MHTSESNRSLLPVLRQLWTRSHQSRPAGHQPPKLQVPPRIPNQSTVSLEEFRRLILELIRGRIANSTLALYAATLSSLIRVIGNIPLITLAPYHFECYTSRRLMSVSPTRANIEFRALRALFSRAVLFQMVPAHPMAGLRQVRMPPHVVRILSQKELVHLLKTIDRKEFRALVIVAVCTAMRAGEIASLRWEDVDFENGVIHLSCREGFQPKNGRGRDVPLSRRAILALKSIHRSSGQVFLKRRGSPYTTHSLSVWFKRYARRAKLPLEIHFHTLRHTAASVMVARNVPVPFVREVLGHSSITTTMQYAHIPPDELHKSLWKIDPLSSAGSTNSVAHVV